MYPRNAASPERIDIGAVVQISDGAVQTSGCTVRIIPAGGAEGDGAGTTAYSDDGVVLYTPTQAETNYTSFILIAKKAGCIPASKTVVTSANATAGKVTVGTNEDKTGYTASTVSDKTGYALAAGHGLATEAKQDTIIGYVDCLPATWVVPAAAGDAMTLTADYDAAKTAAQAGNAMTLTAQTIIDLAAALEAAMINELDGTAVMQALADLIASDMTTGDLSVQAIAAACRDAILNRVLSGNHDTAGTPGKLLQNCDAAVSTRLATAGYTAPPTTAQIKTAMEAEGSHLAAILEDTGTTLPAVLTEIKGETWSSETDTLEDILNGVVYHRTATELTLSRLSSMIVTAGEDNQFKAVALEQAPSGSGATPQEIWEYESRSLTDKIGFGVSSESVLVIADKVWDEPLSAHLDSGSTGEALNASDASGDPWTTQLPGAYGPGSAGRIVGSYLTNIDGLDHATAMKAIISVLFGKTIIDQESNTVEYLDRSGASVVVTVAYGVLDGQRLVSTITI